ncbi:hypothetical protein MTR67_047503 [Solanum verrucosum]|uniref:Uncharacterized protein n=1 Tax=Solanum verrucosum TaxID=315347 RepID=A0AAF0UZK3_SOLVR|nr:hypothetical protein MTR67_047503 [Solanum verrucosum]
MTEQVKNARDSLKGGSLHIGGAKTVGTIAREMFLFIEKRIGTHSHGTEDFQEDSCQEERKLVGSRCVGGGKGRTKFYLERKSGRGTHKGRVYGLGSRNNVRRLRSSLEDIGSSRQAEALDGVQIAVMLAQIAQLTSALVESKRRRVAEQQSMCETIQQIKE